MQKNVSGQKIGAQLVSATDGSNFTGSVTVYVTGDAGTQAAGSVSSGACTHEGNGYHTYAPAQAETNYDLIAFTFTGTGAVSATVQVYTSYPQTGDSFARLGAPAGASVSADVAAVKVDTAAILVDTGTTLQADITAILTDTAEIGAAGAGLTALPWNAAWDAEVQSECTDALNAYDPPTNTEMVAAFTEIKGATWSVTDTLEAIRDRGDAAWTTATGYSTHSASDVWAVGTRVLTANTNLNDPTAAAIADAVWDEVLSGHLTAGTTGAGLNAAGGAGDPWSTSLPGAYGAGTAGYIVGSNLDATVGSRATQTSVDTVDGIVDAILVDTSTTLQAELDGIQADTEDIQTRLPAALVSGRIDANVGAMAANTLTASALATDAVTEVQSGLATTASIAALNNLSAAQVNTEVDAALADYDAPTNTEMVAAFTQIKGATWASTDTLEAIRDRGDAAWITATGYSTLDAAGVRTAVGLASANLDTQLADLPTVAEFEARTLLAASYFDPAVDVVARVTLVDTTTTNTDMRGTNSAATAAALATAQADLDILTGSDGATLATSQPNYAPYTGTPPTVAQIRTEIDSNSTQLAAIVADTNELQTDWANGGRLDLILDARSSQTSVDDLPTNAELSAALAAADDAVLAAIAALNNLSAAQVNAEVVDALATDTYAEPGSVPAATASLKDKLGWLMALARNKITQTSSTQALRNDADAGNIATAAVSDDGTTATRGEWA